MKKTKSPARNASHSDASEPDHNANLEESNSDNQNVIEDFYDDYWNNFAGGENREEKKKKKISNSGKSVFLLKKIITDKDKYRSKTKK